MIRSDLPRGVIEKPIRASEKRGALYRDRTVNCFFKGKLVGKRVYNRAGIMILETPMKDGLKHGREISWSDDGQLLLIEPYAKGKIHGAAKQYGHNGKVIGTYTLVHGSGFDIWRQEDEDQGVFISEIHTLENGFPNGYEWNFSSSKGDLWRESHWKMGQLHGIQRGWNNKGKLGRGYPKFYIADEAVSRQKYIKMSLVDKTLPAYREEDDLPYREWPPEIRKLMSS